MRIGESVGFVPDPNVVAMEQQSSSIELEIDTEVFAMEEQARMLRGDRGYKPRDAVEFQFSGYVFSIGFIHKCSNCGHEGPRKAFNKAEMPPWACPKCRNRKVYQKLPLESERLTLNEPIANHAYRNLKVYPNKMTPDGQVLVEKDNSQPAIPLLVKVSRITGRGVERQESKRMFDCSFCDARFPTLKMLHEHRANDHDLGGGALSEAPKPGVSAEQPTPKPAKVVAAEPPVEADPEATEHETVSVSAAAPEGEEHQRKSPAELKAMMAEAQKGKASGSKAK